MDDSHKLDPAPPDTQVVTLGVADTDLEVNFSSKWAAGTIAFIMEGGEPILELHPNGDILVRGRLITNDQEIVEGLREIISLAHISKVMNS